MLMLPGERLDLIVSRLQADGKVIAADLAAELDVSEDTIRRDLRDLAARGACQRVYGGALLPGVPGGTLAERADIAPDAKADLARAAVERVGRGANLFLDAASTNLAIADALPREFGLTCFTNAPQIAARLLARGDCDVVAIGGLIHREVGAAIGAEAMHAARNLRPDICFLGACGVAPEAGITAVHADDAGFKRVVAEASAMTIVPVTNEKLMTSAAFRVMEIGRCSEVIVENDAPGDAVEACRKAGANIRRCAA